MAFQTISSILGKVKDTSVAALTMARDEVIWGANTTLEAIIVARDGYQWIVAEASTGIADRIRGVTNNVLQSKPVQTSIGTVKKSFVSAKGAGQAIKEKGQNVTKAFISRSPEGLKGFKNQLTAIENAPLDISLEGVQQLAKATALLSDQDNKLLKELAPKISDKELAVCISVFDGVKRVAKNHQNRITADQNPLSKEEEEELLEPLRKEDAQSQLILFSSIMNEIIASNNGYVFKFKDSLVENPKAVITALSLVTAFFTGSWALGAAGAASGASIVKAPSEGLWQVRVFLLGQPLLTDSRSKMIELEQAITKKDLKQIVKFGKSLRQPLRKLLREQATVFTPDLNLNEIQHLANLQTALSKINENDLSSTEQLNKPVENALVVLNKRHDSQKGVFEAVDERIKHVEKTVEAVTSTAKILVERVDERVESVQETVENIAKPIYNAVGWDLPPKPPRVAAAQAQPVPPPPAAAPINPQPVNVSEEGTVSQFLEWAASNLTSLMGGKYAGILSDKALPSAVGFIALILNQILGTLDNSATHAFVKGKLSEIVTALNSAAENKDWKKLPALLQTAANALKNIKIYVGSWRAPVPGTGANLEGGKTADAVLAENIAVLNGAAATPQPEPENQDWKQLALDEKDKLVSNATSFLTMKHIYEEVCGLQPTSEKFYKDLLAKAQIPTSAEGKTIKVLSEEKLKTLFFEELNKRKVGIFKKLYAEIQYWLYAKGVKYFTKKATTIYFHEIFKYIANHEKDKFNIVRGMLINNFTRYLTILGGAYRTVANTPSATGLMSEMLMKELEKPEANLGFETKDLYTDFAKIVLKKTGGSVFGWIASKLLGNPEEIIRSVIDVSTGSIQDANGYTHALNTVIGDQLEAVWKLLQPSPSGQPTATPSNEGSTKISEGQKNQLSILVNNLFEILRKSKCNTVDELRNLMEGKLLSENINQAIDGLFIQDIIEQTTVILASTVESLIQGKQLEKLTYTFANLINNTFEVAEEVEQADMQKAEDRVAKLSEQILGFAVNAAIKDRLDFSGKKQQAEANGFVDQLHAISNAYFNDTTTPDGRVINGASTNLQRLRGLDIASLDAKNKINEIFEATAAYEKKCQDLNQLVNASQINIDNKEEVNKRILELAKKSELFIKDVAQLKTHSESLENLQKAIPRLQKIREITGEIGRRFYDQKAFASKEDIEFAEEQMILMATLIAELQKVGNVKDAITLFTYQQERLEKIIIAQRQALSARSLYSELGQPNSLLEQIVSEKKYQIERLGQILNQENLTLMKQKLMGISSDSLRPQLLEQLKAIENAILPRQIEEAQAAFMRLLNQAVSEANGKILPGRDEHYDCYQKIDGIVNGTRLLEPEKIEGAKRAIRGAIASAEGHLAELKTWENENYKQIVYSNFSWSATKWLQDGISEKTSNFVHGRVRERLDGVLDLLKREETYRYGILHHAVLIPYVQRIQMQKK